MLRRCSELQTGTRQPQEDNNFFSPGAVLSMNGTGALSSDKAAYEISLSEKDSNWKRTEINRKFVILVDNCFPMYMSDPNDTSPMAQYATEEFWSKHATWLNVESTMMKQDKFPRTDRSKWIQEDRKFQNTGSPQDLVLNDVDHETKPSHLTTRQNNTLVITGRDAARTFELREQLVRCDSFMEVTLSRRRDLVSRVILSISLD